MASIFVITYDSTRPVSERRRYRLHRAITAIATRAILNTQYGQIGSRSSEALPFQ